MHILIIGGGGREHALAWKAAQSELVKRVSVAPGNAGTALEAKCGNVPIEVEDQDALLKFAIDEGVNLTIVGPEGPLVVGIVEKFQAADQQIFGPRQAASQRNLGSIVHPLLDHAEAYYLQPMDLIPEMTQGLPGLLDDSYLVIRILQNLEKGPEAFLDWDLEYPAKFLARLIGPRVKERLDQIAVQAMQEVSAQLNELWQRMAHPA